MIKRFIKLNWLGLLLGIIYFAISVAIGISPIAIKDYEFAMIYEEVNQGIIIGSMLLIMFSISGDNTNLKQLGTYKKLFTRIGTIIICSLIIMILDYIGVMYLGATATSMAAVLLVSLVNGLEIYVFVEVVHVVLITVKMKNLD